VFHRQRVLPLTERRLRLDEMMHVASVESSWMASATLPTDELLWWVKGTVGRADYSTIVRMRPNSGYVSLVSSPFLPLFSVLSFSSYSSYPFVGFARISDRSTPGPGRHNRKGGAPVGGRGGEEEGWGEEASP
jgi:hypothetical protein